MEGNPSAWEPSLDGAAVMRRPLLGLLTGGRIFLLLAVSLCSVQSILEDDFTLARRQIVEEILRCDLDEPDRRGGGVYSTGAECQLLCSSHIPQAEPRRA